ncbi:hypothetical protein GCM10009544_02050 [Streptomyces stramineus]|uniref:Uncharacterized protein n=1 Tax=Streptomyces stramineus TaxID=173861 RepID=A0ABN0ZBX4_9ACTN
MHGWLRVTRPTGILTVMEQEPKDTDVKMNDDGELLYFDGKDWVPYLDVEVDGGTPGHLVRGDNDQ